MLGNNKDPEKKGPESQKRIPPPPSFSSKPSVTQGSLGKVPLGKVPDGKPKVDSFQRTNKAERGTGALSANSNMNLTKENREFTEKALDDGAVIIKYNEPQKIDNLIKDAKQRVGGENSKFFSKGWVIGKEVAKISPDGLSITYYPQEVSDLVHELIGYSSVDQENK